MSSFVVVLVYLGLGGVHAEETVATEEETPSESAYEESQEAPVESSYVFGWLDYPSDQPSLRGGTTQGPPVVLASEPSPAWQALQEQGLSNQEQDRRAILALSGEYRVGFDFIETEVYGAHRSLLDRWPAPT